MADLDFSLRIVANGDPINNRAIVKIAIGISAILVTSLICGL